MGLFDLFKKKKATPKEEKKSDEKNISVEPTAEEKEPVKEEKAKPAGKFCIKLANDGTYMFNLKASNGEIIATSQTYSSKKNCYVGIQSVITNAASASVEDLSVENNETPTNPKFQIFVDNGGAYRFRLKAKNGNTIAASQGYSSKSKCRAGIESVKNHAPNAVIIDEEINEEVSNAKVGK